MTWCDDGGIVGMGFASGLGGLVEFLALVST
jgi:hypothetical protein